MGHRTKCQSGHYTDKTTGESIRWINGWKGTRAGTTSFVGSPISDKALDAFNRASGKSEDRESTSPKSGNVWVWYTLRFTHIPRNGEPKEWFVNGYWCETLKLLRIPQLRLVAKPANSKNNGGYFGPISSNSSESSERRNRRYKPYKKSNRKFIPKSRY